MAEDIGYREIGPVEEIELIIYRDPRAERSGAFGHLSGLRITFPTSKPLPFPVPA